MIYSEHACLLYRQFQLSFKKDIDQTYDVTSQKPLANIQIISHDMIKLQSSQYICRMT